MIEKDKATVEVITKARVKIDGSRSFTFEVINGRVLVDYRKISTDYHEQDQEIFESFFLDHDEAYELGTLIHELASYAEDDMRKSKHPR